MLTGTNGGPRSVVSPAVVCAFAAWSIVGCSSPPQPRLTCNGTQLMVNDAPFTFGACLEDLGGHCTLLGGGVTQCDDLPDAERRYRYRDGARYVCAGTCGDASLDCCPAPPSPSVAKLTCDGTTLQVNGAPFVAGAEQACAEATGCVFGDGTATASVDCSDTAPMPPDLGVARAYSFDGTVCRGSCGGNDLDCCPMKNSTATSSTDGWKAVRVDGDIACAQRSDGSVKCWGSYCDGGCKSDVVGPGAALDRFDLRSGVGCGIDLTGAAWCWQLSPSDRYATVSSIPSGSYIAIAGGRDGCAVADDGSATCWGEFQAAGWPPPPPGPWVDVDVDTSALSRCFRAASGSVACEKWNLIGTSVQPLSFTFSGPYVQIAHQDNGYCLRAGTGEVSCFDSSFAPTSSPAGAFTFIDNGCGIRSADATVACWNPDVSYIAPGAFTYLAGPSNACGVLTSSKIACWKTDGLAPLCHDGTFGDLFCLP